MKKILVIAPYAYLPYFSGGQKYIARFLHYLGKRTSLTVISVQDNEQADELNYRLLPLLGKGAFRYINPALVKKITREIRQQPYDAVIWEHPYYAWLAYRVKKKTGIRTIIHTHNIEYQRFRSLGKWWWPLLKLYEKWCFRRADLLFFITPEDKQFAISRWKIPAEKCADLPFGVETDHNPGDKKQARELLRTRHQVPEGNKIILFNGLLRYKPNLDALHAILDQINPLLLQHPEFSYTLLVCGKDLPASLNGLQAYRNKNILYAGFVDDIDSYFKGADLFLNPVQSGGGVKTKMVEAIAWGTTVVASASGAAGMEPGACGDKLVQVPDSDWTAFADAIRRYAGPETATPELYYQVYYWGHITARITLLL